MKIFPTKEVKFKLIQTQKHALEILKRRTEKSENITSQYTNRSFRGKINGTSFKIISATIGVGAFCVMEGEILNNQVNARVQIHKVFKILLGIFLLFPLLAFVVMITNEKEQFSPIFLLVVVGQLLIIRFGFIAFAFKFLCKSSLNRLKDVLDLEVKRD